MQRSTTSLGLFDLETLKAIQKGIGLFNQRRYFECHEELEEAWLNDSANPSRYVTWAILQVAVALYHAQSGNLAGARGLIKKALAKVEYCENNGVENKLLEDSLQWSQFKELIKKLPQPPELKHFESLENFSFPRGQW